MKYFFGAMVVQERFLMVRRPNAKLDPSNITSPDFPLDLLGLGEAIPVMAIVGFSSVAWLRDGGELGSGKEWR